MLAGCALANIFWPSHACLLFCLWHTPATSALICSSNGLLCALQYRAPRADNARRLLEAAGLAALTVVMMLALSYFAGTCVDVPDWHEKDYGFTFHCTDGAPAASVPGPPAYDWAPDLAAQLGATGRWVLSLIQFLFDWPCFPGRYNDLATAFMAFPDKTIGHLFSLGSLSPQVCPVSMHSCAVRAACAALHVRTCMAPHGFFT